MTSGNPISTTHWVIRDKFWVLLSCFSAPKLGARRTPLLKALLWAAVRIPCGHAGEGPSMWPLVFLRNSPRDRFHSFHGRVWWLMPIIPAFLEAKAGGSPEVSSMRPAWPTWRNLISTKNIKISQVWWWVPVIPATQEAEAGESLEFGRQRWQ